MRDLINLVESAMLDEVVDGDESIFDDDAWKLLRNEFVQRKGAYRVIGQTNGFSIVSTQPLSKAFEVYLIGPNAKPLVYMGISGTGQSDMKSVDTVMTAPDSRGSGYAYILYQWFLSQHMRLMSDDAQTGGGKAIWGKLFRDGYPMSIYDPYEQKETPLTDLRAFYAAEDERRLIVRPK